MDADAWSAVLSASRGAGRAHVASRHYQRELADAGLPGPVALLRAAAASVRVRERPVALASHSSGGGPALEIALARQLSRAKIPFHLDWLLDDREAAERARAEIREAGLDDAVTVLHRPGPRAPGSYDLVVALGVDRAPDVPALLDDVARTLAPGGRFVVSARATPGRPRFSPRVAQVLARLWPGLSPTHRYDHVAGGFPAGPAECVLPAAGPADLVAELAARFDAESLTPFGGLTAAFTEPPLGPNFDPARSVDRAFLDHVAERETRLRRAGALAADELVATLVPKGTAESPASFVAFDEPTAPLPSLDDAAFDFPRRLELVSHVMCGSDDPYLADGFFYWEPDTRVRWTGARFSLRFDLPRVPAPAMCRLEVFCQDPESGTGGAEAFVNGSRVARVEDVYGAVSRAPDHRLDLSFGTLGGPTTVTWVLDETKRPANPADRRDLGLVVQAFSVEMDLA
jgi:hypothetical protein